MVKILPKNKAPGVDICGTSGYFYIIRSDLGVYVETSSFNTGSNLTVRKLHPSCMGGDHYLADASGYFYIIKGSSYRRVCDLSTDSKAEVFPLHPNCQGGDHYLFFDGYFHIILENKDKEFPRYHRTYNLTENTYSSTQVLRLDIPQGLYYWGSATEFNVLKPVDEWGVQYCAYSDLSESATVHTYSFSPDVTVFLPAGLAVVHGEAFSYWENIKTISNDSVTPISWNKKITKKIGYVKEKLEKLEHNWKVGLESSISFSFFVKFQLSLSAEYGGSSLNTEKENWEEAIIEEETMSFTLKPEQRISVWQYVIGFGKEKVLFSRHIKFDDSLDPPTEEPIPHFKSE